MRIISGSHKGKRLMAPSNMLVRPTTDFAKEALFNIVNNHFDFYDIRVLDLFTGTGNISYEFAARGALQVLSVDNNNACIEYIKKTAEKLDFSQIQTIRTDANSYLVKYRQSWDIIFADPPYDYENYQTIPELVFSNKLLAQYGWLIIEHSAKTTFGGHPNLFDQRKYGSVCFSFFKDLKESEI
jgi:16S rRNA (guanine966-N2)-methyltransferase